MKDFEVFSKWINNNFTLNVYDGISIVSLINGIKDDGIIKNMISEFSVHEVSRDVERSSYGIEYDVSIYIQFKDGTSVRTKNTLTNGLKM